MKTLTIRLPDSLADRIARQARVRKVSKSEIVREHLDQPVLTPSPGNILRDILEESWAAPVPERPARILSPKKQKLVELIRAKKLHR